jgi:hypothetical protein
VGGITRLYGYTREELQKAYEDEDWDPPNDIVDILFDLHERILELTPKDYV